MRLLWLEIWTSQGNMPSKNQVGATVKTQKTGKAFGVDMLLQMDFAEIALSRALTFVFEGVGDLFSS